MLRRGALAARAAGGGRLHAYAKTSGSKGLHVLVPLQPTPSEKVSAYAKSLAVEGEAALPRLVLHRLTRSLRPGKVFVDHSQNAAAKTTAPPTPCAPAPNPPSRRP